MKLTGGLYTVADSSFEKLTQTLHKHTKTTSEISLESLKKIFR